MPRKVEELDSSVEAALHRELSEELGATVTGPRLRRPLVGIGRGGYDVDTVEINEVAPLDLRP